MGYQISEECGQCGRCQRICPAGAIVKKDRQYVIIVEKCESCGTCAAECPKGAITFAGPWEEGATGNGADSMPASMCFQCEGRGGRRGNIFVTIRINRCTFVPGDRSGNPHSGPRP